MLASPFPPMHPNHPFFLLSSTAQEHATPSTFSPISFTPFIAAGGLRQAFHSFFNYKARPLSPHPTHDPLLIPAYSLHILPSEKQDVQKKFFYSYCQKSSLLLVQQCMSAEAIRCRRHGRQGWREWSAGDFRSGPNGGLAENNFWRH